MSASAPVKVSQTVYPDGRLVDDRIVGLIVRPETHIVDPRGELVEIYSPAWNLHPEPLVYAYQVRINRGQGRGWVVHAKQDDRIHHCVGTLHWAFYDDRKDSPTHGMLNKITISERNTALIVIPKGVYHAVMNVGSEDAIMINLPTKPYNHADPDKFRLPFQNDLIPYDFGDLGPQ
ncbi:hypothetical protein CCAX7_65700 [Capsulimonas corticalis]|uniref:Uncharacterized protein n=1 Tax=Capsulimonas corticalis TaxID=2219043 RepID=A0A402CR77_9BACT|nr:dTDP-4-dehydrorhamnose 3,5-epimerase family protein [Capsulimonas corticalis]BDI34519.1 hypothetical protein CCAX7_65700 [Capsulimonas corticalis]